MNDVKLEGLKFVRMRGTFLALTKDQLELLKILSISLTTSYPDIISYWSPSFSTNLLFIMF